MNRVLGMASLSVDLKARHFRRQGFAFSLLFCYSSSNNLAVTLYRLHSD